MKQLIRLGLFLIILGVLSGCGYTQKSKMPNDIKKLAVPTFINTIQAKKIYTYQAGLEVKLTNEIRNRILFDGNCKLTEPAQADAALIGKLVHFSQEPLGYDQLERVDRYRLYIVTDITLKDLRTNQVIWHEPNFVGEVIYDTKGSTGITQTNATDVGIKKLARDIVDRMVEDW
ncbi:MAG: hypothetical protein HZC17_03575 [Candidatus Omnitrophica bacterium]|nr:hypothetical protein [Candidatus Omnitrophota bacterium]